MLIVLISKKTYFQSKFNIVTINKKLEPDVKRLVISL